MSNRRKPKKSAFERFQEWHEQNTERLAKAHEENMKQWKYMSSDEYLEELRQKALDSTHADIIPPWEED